ncbi:hypothetical protein CHLNCDRAFT_141835 [Chlorella variabilis]|uniref:RING-type domain-containing protein n=1 Tax=Chlorella variabilis TaxID=554065 RepID=E1ZTP3_CHLVA|nr:hypothetical protein CHLNCDRAFT_141835 [Chlorella variabilis]EFN50803.1 hypothetical protein CHLNCDRAFT_141835 [Chlorella variabilis]|eukprot:XP_005842905.1 hypothetical protein CHLNCDRAFT_141835 [Chlorella variabilis]
MTALHCAACTNPDPAAVRAVIEALVAAGADVHAKDFYGQEPLHWATRNSNAGAAAAAVQALVAAGADVRAKANTGTEPLHWAALNEPPAAVVAAARTPLQAGACTSAVDRNGSLPRLVVLRRPDAAQCGPLLQLLTPGQLLTPPHGERSASAAGALPGGTGGSGAAAASRQLPQNRQSVVPEAHNGECVVCWSAPRSVALLPCGHLALCAGCAATDLATKRCPVCCRVCCRPAGKTVTIYHP